MVDRGALSFASEHIIGAFGFDSAQWGEILGFFGYGYMFGALIGGVLLDLMGRPEGLGSLQESLGRYLRAAPPLQEELGLTLFGGSALAGFASHAEHLRF